MNYGGYNVVMDGRLRVAAGEWNGVGSLSLLVLFASHATSFSFRVLAEL